MKKTVISGIQVSGNLHLGNYLGALNHWISLQDNYNCLFFLADLHTITVDIAPQMLKESLISTTAIYIAAGLDPEKSIIFPQSLVKEHAELAWILNCVTPIGWLSRMTQFKDKSAKNDEAANLGLFSYPVLMAADILLYKADLVPVGHDQKQHLELTRDIAGVINRKFGKQIFNLPDILQQSIHTRIKSLKEGKKKMSKSDSADFSRINLADSKEVIFQKIRKATTDAIPYLSYDSTTRPEISNLLDIYASLSGQNYDTIINHYGEGNMAKFKADLAEIIVAQLSPINNKYLELMQNQDYLLTILYNGAERARAIAAPNLQQVKQMFGLIT